MFDSSAVRDANNVGKLKVFNVEVSMDEKELFHLIRKNYSEANRDYLKEQVKEALSEPTMTKEETLDGLLNYIVVAGCTGMNDLYRKFLYSAIGYLS